MECVEHSGNFFVERKLYIGGYNPQKTKHLVTKYSTSVPLKPLTKVLCRDSDTLPPEKPNSIFWGTVKTFSKSAEQQSARSRVMCTVLSNSYRVHWDELLRMGFEWQQCACSAGAPRCPEQLSHCCPSWALGHAWVSCLNLSFPNLKRVHNITVPGGSYIKDRYIFINNIYPCRMWIWLSGHHLLVVPTSLHLQEMSPVGYFLWLPMIFSVGIGWLL